VGRSQRWTSTPLSLKIFSPSSKEVQVREKEKKEKEKKTKKQKNSVYAIIQQPLQLKSEPYLVDIAQRKKVGHPFKFDPCTCKNVTFGWLGTRVCL